MTGDHPATRDGTSADSGDGLADLTRRAFLDSEGHNGHRTGSAQRQAALNRLWTRLTPQVDRMAMKLCRSNHPSLTCSGPGQCTHRWCDEASAYLMAELLDPARSRSLAVRIARHPDARDADVTGWVASLRNNLWTETRRALLGNLDLPQRVDVWVRGTPHRDCLHAVLEEALGEDLQLLEAFGPVTIEAWAEAFAADAVQWASAFPNCDRVLRHLGRLTSERARDHATDADLAAACRAIRRVDAAFTTYDEAACVHCGGQPNLDDRARLQAATTVVATLDEAEVERMIDAGNVETAPNGTVRVVDPQRAGRIILFATPPRSATVDDDDRRPPWFTRFVLDPRTHFLEARPSGVAVERLAEPELDDDVDEGDGEQEEGNGD